MNESAPPLHDPSPDRPPARRRWLRDAAAIAAGGATVRFARAVEPDTAGRRLVVVMLRGAVDGLSVVVPHGDPDYPRGRHEIAIAAPGADDGALRLDSLFGLHPALGALMPLWAAGRLAFVQASGSPDLTRSHFDAQDFMESGTPGRRSTADGWLNRLVAELGRSDRGVIRGVNLGPSMPRILAGSAQVAALPAGQAPRRVAQASPELTAALDRLYGADAGAGPAWAALRQTSAAIAAADTEGMDPGIAPGAVPLAALAQDAGRLGRLLRREPTMRAAFFSVGGWDTHVNQGGARGPLANRLQALAAGLGGLVEGLGDRFDDTVILVMSEFGRTVAQNGTQGTDHGHGNVMWLLGGGVDGGRVHGRWPGLDRASLHHGRDLAITTDFRQVIAEVLERHLRLDDTRLARVLPQGTGGVGRVGVLRG